MEVIAVIYTIFFIMMGFSLFILVAFIAGKDIVMAFQRRFMPKGCDVYVANNTRKISHYYKIPKDGVFRINKLPYVTNPEKTMNLTIEEQQTIRDALFRRQTKLKKRITEYEIRIKELKLSLNKTQDEKAKHYIKYQINHFDKLLKDFKDKLRIKQENYFKDKRPAFFYMENDPIPKDFYEFYSGFDSKLIDNLVTRAITEPQDDVKKQDQTVKLIKLFVMIAMAAAVAAAFLAFRNNAMLIEVCQKVGASCNF